MSDQNMRGMRLGATSLETAAGAGLEPRFESEFVCTEGHVSKVIFAVTAELPDFWECKVCGKNATRQVEGAAVETAATEESAGRSHWQMLLERRSIPELEEILEERLEYLRERRAKAS